MWQAIFEILGILLATGLVLFLAWFVLGLVNRRMPGGNPTTRHLKVLDRVQLGKSGSLVLVRVKGKVFLLAMNDHAIETVYTFDDDGSEPDVPAGQIPGFSKVLRDAVKRFSRQPGGKGEEEGTDE